MAACGSSQSATMLQMQVRAALLFCPFQSKAVVTQSHFPFQVLLIS